MTRPAARTLIPALLLVLLSATGTATVSYDIDIGPETTRTNVSFQLYANDSVNSWKAQWSVPADAEIVEAHDSLGPIEDIERSGSRVSFETNSGDRRHSEVVTLVYEYPTDVTSYRDIVKIASLQLSGFPDRYPQYDEEVTQVEVTTPSPIIGTAETFGFEHSREGQQARFQGEGPVNVKVSYGTSDDPYEHFLLVGDANLTRADEAYPLLARITGYRPSFRTMAVVVLPDAEYDQREQSWSSGTYHRGGVITVRNSTVSKDTFTGTVMHEAMHGFNQRQLAWSGDAAAVLDEGTAQYAEWLTNTRNNARISEIFGQERTWTGPCSEDSEQRCRFSLAPRLTPDHLISYYEQGQNLMAGWKPADGGSVMLAGNQTSLRTFGYAYAELLVRNHARRNGPDSIRDIYRDARQYNTTVDGPQDYWTRMQELFGNAEPCRFRDDEEVRTCLDNVNSMEAELPSETSVEGGSEEITFTPIRTPERDQERDDLDQEPVNTTNGTPANASSPDRPDGPGIRSGLNRILDTIVTLFNAVVTTLGL